MTEDRADLFGKRLQIVTKLKSLIAGELASVDASRQTLTLTNGTVVSSQNPSSVRKFANMVIDASNVQTIEEALSQRPPDPAVVEMRPHNGSLVYPGEGDRKLKKGFLNRRDQLAHFDLAFSTNANEQRQHNGVSEDAEATHRFARSSSVPPESFFRGPPSAHQSTAPRGRYTPKRSNALTRLRVSRSTFNKVVVRRNFASNNAPRRNSECDLVAQTNEFENTRRSDCAKTLSLNVPNTQHSRTFFDEEIVASKENSADSDTFLQSIADKAMPCDDLPTEYISEPSYSKKSFFDNLLVTTFTGKKQAATKFSAGVPSTSSEKEIKAETKNSDGDDELENGERSEKMNVKSRSSASISGRNLYDLNAETFGMDSVRAYRLNAPYAKRTGDTLVDRDGTIQYPDGNRNIAQQSNYRNGFFTSCASSFAPYATTERSSNRALSTGRKKTLHSRFASDTRAYSYRSYTSPQAMNYRYAKFQTASSAAANATSYGGYSTDLPRSILKNRGVAANYSRTSGQLERTKLKAAGLGFSFRYAYPQAFSDTTYFKRADDLSGSSNAYRFDEAFQVSRKRRNLEGRQARV